MPQRRAEHLHALHATPVQRARGAEAGHRLPVLHPLVVGPPDVAVHPGRAELQRGEPG